MKLRLWDRRFVHPLLLPVRPSLIIYWMKQRCCTRSTDRKTISVAQRAHTHGGFNADSILAVSKYETFKRLRLFNFHETAKTLTEHKKTALKLVHSLLHVHRETDNRGQTYNTFFLSFRG